MEFELPSPVKDWPSGAVMQRSRFKEQSALVSGEDASATQYGPPFEGTAAPVLPLPPEKSDNRSDNIIRSVFIDRKFTKKYRHFSVLPALELINGTL